MNKYFLSALLAALLIAGCFIGSVKYGSGENEPPATVYVFNLDSTRELIVYEEVAKPASLDQAMNQFAGGSHNLLKRVAIVGGQQYTQFPVRPRGIMLRATLAPSPFGDAPVVDYPDNPGPSQQLEALFINADSYQTYYATAYSRGVSATVYNFFKGAVLSGTPLGIFREKYQGLGDVVFEQISTRKGRELLTQFKPQDSPGLPQKMGAIQSTQPWPKIGHDESESIRQT
jgi:hypothetical protein